MSFQIVVDYKEYSSYEHDWTFDELYTSIDFFINGQSFFKNYFRLAKKIEKNHKDFDEWIEQLYINPNGKEYYPLFQIIIDLNISIKNILDSEILILDEDSSQEQLVFHRIADEIHIFFYPYSRVWYDGKTIIASKEIPKKSNFIVDVNEFVKVIEDSVSEIQEFLLKRHSNIYKMMLVQRSFGLDKKWNEEFGNYKKTFTE
ncbi:hypothetical protein [Bacillus cihuensis]|uniref:hypothetical protein n=1 Tax=Bacillus cihuensis TaxID=1208599 RepID=UPI000408988C|nr:hypothetical protein [Bacillus cihuensis]